MSRALNDHWTKEQEDTLRCLHALGTPVKGIAEVLGRTVDAINSRACDLDLERRRKPWTEEEEEDLRRLHAEGMSLDEIAAMMSRSLASVKGRASRLGLRHRVTKPRKSAPHPGMKRTSRTPIYDPEIGPALVCSKCRELWPAECFARNGESRFQSWCQACNTEQVRELRALQRQEAAPLTRRTPWHVTLRLALFSFATTESPEEVPA